MKHFSKVISKLYMMTTSQLTNRGSSVGIVPNYEQDGPGGGGMAGATDLSLLSVQTGFGAQLTSYLVDTDDCFRRYRSGEGMNLTT
jgi:hypothetical protein